MKNINKKKANRIMIGALAIVLLMGVVATPSLHASLADCEKALARCAADAVIAGLTGGPLVFSLWSSGCLMGYDFCMKYYDG
jgi:hypothetical protein